MDAPQNASLVLDSSAQYNLAQSCIRPLDRGASFWPRSRMEMRGPGPYRLRELERSPFSSWFACSRLDDRKWTYMDTHIGYIYPHSASRCRRAWHDRIYGP